jgi:hypothetical protein
LPQAASPFPSIWAENQADGSLRETGLPSEYEEPFIRSKLGHNIVDSITPPEERAVVNRH